jgi:pimeloyl-ACP methyl ester carboxylesterase
MAQESASCRALLRHLGIERAHLVGHSSSGCMALPLALDAPEAEWSPAHVTIAGRLRTRLTRNGRPLKNRLEGLAVRPGGSPDAILTIDSNQS